jgi:hypothetical protein
MINYYPGLLKELELMSCPKVKEKHGFKQPSLSLGDIQVGEVYTPLNCKRCGKQLGLGIALEDWKDIPGDDKYIRPSFEEGSKTGSYCLACFFLVGLREYYEQYLKEKDTPTDT